jgi:hypothetical protein
MANCSDDWPTSLWEKGKSLLPLSIAAVLVFYWTACLNEFVLTSFQTTDTWSAPSAASINNATSEIINNVDGNVNDTNAGDIKDDSKGEDNDDNSITPEWHYDGDICSIFQSKPGLNSPTAFWMQSLKTGRIQKAILAAPDNSEGSLDAHLQELSSKVLATLSPAMFRRSIHHFAASSNKASNYRAKFTEILEKVKLRYNDFSDASLKKTENEEHEKVKILVFGGSPTAGSNCYRNGALKKNKAGPCAWPGHLEGFLNSYIGFDAFEVVNYAIGASDSSLAVTIMQHGLIPPSMKGPDHTVDIVIYAYSVNDFGRSWSDGKFLHDFIMAADNLAPCKGPGPITLLLEDLVVNFNRYHQIDQAEEYHSKFIKMAQWHELPLVSYSNVVKRPLLHNTSEELLVDWTKDSKHAPRGGHIAITLTLAFNFLNMVQQHCDDGSLYSSPARKMEENKPSALMDPIHLPSLENHPSLLTVTKSWQNNTSNASERKNDKCSNGGQDRCAFAFLATRKEQEHSHLTDDPNDIMKESQGWMVDTSWPPDNYGFKASEANATAHFLLHGTVPHADGSKTSIQIKSMGITYMKSYSEKWIDSNLHVDIFHGSIVSNITNSVNDGDPDQPTILASADYSGFHETLTSEYYTEVLDFEGHEMGEDLNVTFRMTSGNTFKIVALTFC